MNETQTEDKVELPFPKALNNIAIVLVHPQFPGNIGSVCRTMKNHDLSDLRLIHPPLDRRNEASRMAHGATDLLESAKRVFTIEEALGDISFVVGTTARLGGWRSQILQPHEGAQEILKAAQSNRVALLFGSEDTGLSNEVVKRCQLLVTIPTSKQHRSLNLSHAVAILGYELFKEARCLPPALPSMAKIESVEAMFEDLTQALTLINFLRPGNPDYWMLALRRLFARTGLSEREVNLLRGICRQIRWVHGLKGEIPPLSHAQTPEPEDEDKAGSTD